MQPDPNSDDFFVEDEPLEEVIAAFEQGEKHMTSQPVPAKVLEALPLLIQLWQAWSNTGSVDPSDTFPEYVEMLDRTDSLAMENALSAIEPYEKALIDYMTSRGTGWCAPSP
jgi:hypothetical protein